MPSLPRAPHAEHAGGSDGLTGVVRWPNRLTLEGRDDGLTVERLVSVTVELLDEVGVEAFSMRSLALRLGRSQMAAYRHVGGRDELLLLAALEVESILPTSVTDLGTSGSRRSCGTAGRPPGRPIPGSSS